MLRNPQFATITVSLYLLAYCILSQFESAGKYVLYLFLASPVLVIWLVMTVLMHGRYNGKSLGDREFGYQDKEDDELGTF